MPPKQEPISLDDDLGVVYKLTEAQIQKIITLLDQKSPTKKAIREHSPEGFLRVLNVYSKVLNAPGQPQRVLEIIAPVEEWFREKIPRVETRTGYKAFLTVSEEALHGRTVSLPTDSEVGRMMAILNSKRAVNGYHCEPSLGGKELAPKLRVFLLNREQLLLDSTGDWDDWLYVIRCLLGSLEEQANAISGAGNLWGNLPWEKISQHLPEIKKRLKSFDNLLRENIPSDVKVPGIKKKK